MAFVWESEPTAVVGLLKIEADLSGLVVRIVLPRRVPRELALGLGVGGTSSTCCRGSREFRKDVCAPWARWDVVANVRRHWGVCRGILHNGFIVKVVALMMVLSLEFPASVMKF
jgi:hypothetical protein